VDANTSWWTSVLAGPGGDLFADGSGEQYLALPKSSDPRVVVDKSEPAAVRDAIDRMVSSRTGFGPAKALAGGASSVLARRKPSWSVGAGASKQTLREHLSEVLNTDVRISISVGPPRPNRKPVVRCYSSSGMIAVAKLGPEAHTAKMVQNEGRWLDVMTAKPLDGVITPPLLHLGEYGMSTLLVMGVLDLKSDLGLDFADVPFEHAEEITERYAEHVPLSESTWWHGLASRMDDAKLDSVKAQLSLTTTDSHFDQVKTGAWHGDWSPWNMGLARNGKLCIWDWERAALSVPVGFDLLHLHYQYGDGLAAADSDLARMGIPVELNTILRRLYLFELCARHCEAGALDTDRHAEVIAELAEVKP